MAFLLEPIPAWEHFMAQHALCWSSRSVSWRQGSSASVRCRYEFRLQGFSSFIRCRTAIKSERSDDVLRGCKLDVTGLILSDKDEPR